MAAAQAAAAQSQGSGAGAGGTDLRGAHHARHANHDERAEVGRDAVVGAGRVADAEEEQPEEQVEHDGHAEARAQRGPVADHVLRLADAERHELRPQPGLPPRQPAVEVRRGRHVGRHGVGIELGLARLVVVAHGGELLPLEGLHEEHDVVGWVGLVWHGEAERVEVRAEAVDGAVIERAALAEEEHAVEEVEDLRGRLVDGAEDGAA